MRRVIFEIIILVSILYFCDLIIRKNDMTNYMSNVDTSILLLNALEDNKTQKIKLILSSDIFGVYQMIQNDKDMKKYKRLCYYIKGNQMPCVEDLYKNISTPKIENELKKVFKIAKQGRDKLNRYCKEEN